MYKKLNDDSLNAILEAGIREFSLNGPDRASIRAIAAEAGVSVGVIYKYFSDKDGLFLSCVRHSLELLDEVLAQAARSGDSVEDSAEAVLRALLENARTHGSYNAMYHEISSGSCRRYAPLLASEIEQRSARAYTALFEKAREQGRLRPDLDPAMAAFFFDNLLITLQFSYSCDYYQQRMKIFCGEDIQEHDEKIIRAFRAFLGAVLTPGGAERRISC